MFKYAQCEWLQAFRECLKAHCEWLCECFFPCSFNFYNVTLFFMFSSHYRFISSRRGFSSSDFLTPLKTTVTDWHLSRANHSSTLYNSDEEQVGFSPVDFSFHMSTHGRPASRHILVSALRWWSELSHLGHWVSSNERLTSFKSTLTSTFRIDWKKNKKVFSSLFAFLLFSLLTSSTLAILSILNPNERVFRLYLPRALKPFMEVALERPCICS